MYWFGKGVVYDTGGLSLKPTANSMDMMKCDMAGAAAVVGLFQAVASNKLPVHIIGLIPATDNRPGGNAYVPGDVIEMYSGKTVEMLNADAEGRMICRCFKLCKKISTRISHRFSHIDWCSSSSNWQRTVGMGTPLPKP